jgi:hypothetical protein
VWNFLPVCLVLLNQTLLAMRKLLAHAITLFSLITVVLLVSSCEKSAEIKEADLIGTWDIGQASVDIKVGPISLLNFLKTSLQFADQEAQDFVDQLATELDNISGGTITFEADYSYQMVHGDLEENGTWNLEGEKLYLTVNGETPDVSHLNVESLDSSSALLVLKEDQEIDVNQDGDNDITATVIIEFELSKQ